jgi:ribonuclease E
MTRKRIGSGLLESFSETCEHCNGRGIRVSLHGEHDHGEASPKYRRPANAVDPADVAARALHLDEPHHVAADDLDIDVADVEVELPERSDADDADADTVFAEPTEDFAEPTEDLAEPTDDVAEVTVSEVEAVLAEDQIDA